MLSLMRSATGTYSLDPATAHFFGAQNLRLISRGTQAIGKLGRQFAVRGSFDGRVLHAVWKSPEASGWMLLNFEADFTAFDGAYGDGENTSPPLGSCSGRVPR
jgi:hypothetical protein